MLKKSFGIVPIAIILIIAGVLILGGGVYFWQKSKISVPNQIACTQEAKECPDGSYVSRTGPNCEFAKCQEKPQCQKDSDCGLVQNCGMTWECQENKCYQLSKECPIKNANLAPSGAEEWKIYQNKEYGFEVRYPATLKIIENPQTPEAYLYSVSFENPLADKTTAGQKIVFNVTVFKDNNQLQSAFKSLTLDDMGKVMIGGYEAQKLFIPKGRAMSFTEATIYTVAAKNTALIFYGADFSETSEANIAKILSSFKFTK